ncbi:hypothetical protein Q8A67_016095 [Cirrhinus molitorella]|uniref:Cytochrome P450 2U1 n=1 Tax=Cirrhinus molitorella TaxID=172907 RepID=A0AA88TKG8_9TELE|nr:hypothetical protein Q8A67_016095 [Cirrhinus molitorella]
MWMTLMKLDLVSVGLALSLGLIFMVFFEIFRIHSYRGKIPPGPRPLPFVGTIPQFLFSPMEFIRSLSQYGEMTTMYIGRQPAIFLNTIEIVKEAMVQNASSFSGRPPIPLLMWVTEGYGIVMATYGHSWRQQRRFALHSLRNFGLGKKSVEDRVTEESRYLVSEMLKLEGKPFDPQHAIQNAVSNIICSIVFGDRFDYDDKRFAYLLEIVRENIIQSGAFIGQVFNLLPIMKHFPGPHQKIYQNAEELKAFIRDVVKTHRESLDPDSPRDLIDAYLLEMEKQKSNEDSTFHEDNMVMTVSDLFLAGTDTTATTIRWGLIFLTQNPEVQERCHEEIVQVLGYDRLPSMDDRDKLPYTYATVHEIQRCGNIVPSGVFHETTQPTKLRGYDIPKGTVVFANLTAILTSKEHWKHPDTFNPENFLDDNGHFFKPESFLPFSLGPRVCLGETLAKTELFLFLTSLLQRIRFSWPPGKPFDPQHAIQNAVSNIICSIVFGDRFDYDDKRFAYLLEILKENIIQSGSLVGQVFNLLPIIKHFPGPHQKIYQNAVELKAFIRDAVKTHRETLDPDSPRDFIDAYLLEMEKQKTIKDSTFHEDNLVMSVSDLFLAGTDTTATTIRWGLIYLTQNPHVQERCHEEIVQVLGYDRLPSMDGRDKLPYTYATVHEIQHCANIVPSGVFHETTQPTKLRGYDIPKGTEVFTNLTAILTDKEHWKHPDTFNPENFLDENGHFFKPESFLPFSLGPRVCLGESLAKMELFLFITSLLQWIRFSWPPGAKWPDMNGIVSLTRSPEPFDIICHSRGSKK